jgi:biotin carboxyl carrier protein
MNTKAQHTKFIALGSNNAEYDFTVKNNYEFSYKKQKIKIELIEEADGFTILSGKGVRYPVEILSRKQNTYEVIINGVSYTFSVETPFSLKRTKLLATQKSPSKTEKIRAPMPGKILDVMVTQGQAVNRGEALYVLEAMKMQNTITAHTKGIINKIVIKTGDTVGKDDMLIEIESLPN